MISRSWRASFLIVLFLTGALLAASQGGKSSQPDQAASVDPQNLIKQLQEAHRKNPADHQVEAYLGMLLYQRNPEDPEARKLMESAATHLLDRKDLQLMLLDCYLVNGETSKIPAWLQAVQSQLDSNERQAFDVIYTLVRYRQLDLAKTQLDRISSRLQERLKKVGNPDPKDPANQELIHNIGEVFFILGLMNVSSDRKDEAMKLFQLADRYDFPPRDSVQMLMLADGLYQMGNFELSAQAYAEYLKHFPDDVQARFRSGVSLYSNGQFSEARTDLERALKADESLPEAHYYLGAVLVELKENDAAETQFHKDLEANPKSYRSMSELAYLSYLKGDNQGCQDWLRKAEALDPNWTETKLVYGLLYNRLREYDKAVKFLESALKDSPDSPKAHFQLGIAYQRLGNAEKAKEHMDRYNQLIQAQRDRIRGIVK